MLIEAVLTAVIVLLMMIFAGIPVYTIIEWSLIILSGILLLTILFFILFFVITSFSLLFYQHVKGSFSRFDDSGRWERAVYLVDGKEYICRFPAESVLRSKIYKEGKTNDTSSLLISRGKKNTAYDQHSLMIIAVGTVVSVCLIVLLSLGMIYYLHFMNLY